MSLPRDLLDQAKYLAEREPRRPKQASLRRAVSAAYYALFHLLISEASDFLLRGRSAAPFRPLLRRTFVHTEMKRAATMFAGGTVSAVTGSVLGSTTVSIDLRQTARAFVDLQEARHEADYDFSRNLSRSEVVDLIDQAENAFECWERIKDTLEAKAFLVNLFSYERLIRR